MFKFTCVFCFLVILLTACSSATATIPVITPSVEESTTTSSPDPGVSPTLSLDFARAREELVQNGIVANGITDSDVIEVIGIVPRHEFVSEDIAQLAYLNRPLPIGYGQTISQPYIVALMTQELEISQGDKVLEIGTGSGYQAAVLAELGAEVYTIEIIGPLAEQAEGRFRELGYTQIETRHADGYYGWREESPFKAIIVTAAPDHVPPPLLEQLQISGVMVIPVGPVGGYQELWKIRRIAENEFERTSLGGVRFVPFTRLGEEPSEQVK